MAQDKSAEIIKFSGAGEPPQTVAPESAPEPSSDDAPSLEDLGAGAFLRAARERANLTVDAVSNATKVKAEHIEAIEWMRLDRLPALPYATGFVKAYARYLGLDAEATAAAFKAAAQAAAPAPVAAPAPERESPQGDGARLGSVFAMFAIILFVLWVIFQVLGGGREPAEPANPQARVEAPQPAPVLAEEPEQSIADVDAPALISVTDPATDIASADEDAAPSSEEAAPEAAAIPENAPQPEAPAPIIETAAVVEQEQPVVPAPAAEPRERPLPRRPRPAAPPRREPVIVEADLLRAASPDYPNRCTRGANDMESVTIRFDVSAEGRAVNARVASSTNTCFEGEALRTVGRWRFSPRSVDGAAAVETGKTATVNFRK